jgi:hypothetical protein
MMQSQRKQPFPWRLFLCELSGTAVLVLSKSRKIVFSEEKSGRSDRI